ncbi:SAM-dependent methyltransferase [Enterococcus faecium]|nr:SAM-dependent methyltransferase [Enterococcus faecium]
MIVLDPPSFARNKKKVFRVAKDYGELVKDSLDILAEDGILIASTNAANVSIEQFQTMIEEEFHAKMFLLNNLLYIVCQKISRRRIPF